MRRLGEILAGDLTHTSSTSSAGAEGDAPVEREAPECPRCNDAGFLRLRRPVGHPEFGQVVACDCARRRTRAEQAERLQRYSNLGPLSRVRFDDVTGADPTLAEAGAVAAAFARREALAGQPEPSAWLWIWGPHALKTALGAAMANDRITRGEPALYFVVPDLLDHLRAAYGKDASLPFPTLFEKVRNAPFLLLDDIDASNPTAWAEEKLFQLLNHRQSVGLPTVVLSARGPGGLGERLGALLEGFVGRQTIALPAGEAGGQGESGYKQIGGMSRDRLERYTFDAFHVQGQGLAVDEAENLALVRAVTREWASAPRGWLSLVGDTGTGKTHLAAAIARERCAAGDRVFFAVVPDLLDHLRRAYHPSSGEASYDELLEDLRAADLLVLDDLGAHSTTAWAEEKLYQLFSYRSLQAKATVITTNHNPTDLDPRLASRLLDHEIGQVYRLVARDHRTGTRGPAVSPPGRTSRRQRPSAWDTPRW